MSLGYKNSGVDIEKADNLVNYLGMKGFGATVKLSDDISVVLSTDGVGTKLLVAEHQNKFDTIGIDLVAMCANDVLCQGAKPHSFLDYYATGELSLEKSKIILDGILKGCDLAGCKLVGGETAEMPGVYTGTKFDLAGFCMGIVVDTLPKKMKANDLIIGIPSSGPHSNGYSLLRKILPLDEIPLEPTRIYTKEIINNIDEIRACAHITGGGIHGNISRILGDYLYNFDIEIPNGWWKDTFKQSKLSKYEFESVFNCGWGMIVVSEKELDIPESQILGIIVA
tara:strand:+ start:1171 stop:2016 length:846 start_codon:yes stop_codon:yes gene_type:complete